ncbi:MAG: S8 family serine peptidase, partial [Nanoarchaeota archaeon]|nr:S8 family serine peptidase [Nanoarchaeota archaeon]
MRCVKLFLCIVIFILVSSLCYAAQVEDLVFDSLDSDGEVDVIVVLKDTSAIETANKFVVQAKAENKFNVLENKKKEIKKNQDKVLNKHKNFKAKHVYSTINAFSGKVDSATLADLQNDPDVERVLFDKSLKIQLTDSVPLISADDVWKRQINGFNITGKGVGVCVIDSGIDYTHESLGACSPTQLTLGGNNESYVLESIHPYANSFDYMWKITKQGYNNISVHFQNISLEYPGQDGYDTADRILIYNSNKEQIAVYHGAAGGLADIWTPYSEGDTIYIRLVTDGSVTDYGFYIDETRNGTTDTSYDWSACKKVIGGWDFINNDGLPMDDNGHGTHVAGIVAANGSVIGVAPEASLVAIKSMDSSGSGQDSNIAAGIDWCVNNSLVHNISVITMSIGGGGPYTDLNCPVNAFLIEASLQSAHQAGIFVAIASGNDGFSNGLSYPACSPYAISVGATDKSDNMASYSNTGSNLDLVAPGSSIISTKVGGGSYLNSGTSMACPHVAGVAALIMQERNELGLIAYGHDRLEELMKNSSLVNVTDVYDFPRVEAYRALNDACDGADSSYRNTTYYY